MAKKTLHHRSPAKHRDLTRHLSDRRLPDIEPTAGRPLNPLETRLLLRSCGFRSYQDYLYSPTWLEIRRRVLKRSKGRCEYCGARAVQVHHEIYTAENLAGESLFGLYAVCRRCHEVRHGLL